MQIVYLGGDTRKHSEKEKRVRQERGKSIICALLKYIIKLICTWATRAQPPLRSLCGKFGEIVNLRMKD